MWHVFTYVIKDTGVIPLKIIPVVVLLHIESSSHELYMTKLAKNADFLPVDVALSVRSKSNNHLQPFVKLKSLPFTSTYWIN